MIHISKSITLLIISIILFFSMPASSQPVKKKPVKTYTVAYLRDLFVDVALNDVNAALNLYTSDFLKSINVDGEYSLQAKIYNSIDEVYNSISKDHIAVVSMSTYDYIKSSGKRFLNPVFVPSMETQTGLEYLLLVRNDDNIKSLADLENKSMGVIAGSLHMSSIMWLELLLNNEKLKSQNHFFNKIEETSKESQLILNVFFGNLNSCVVSKPAFDLMNELNPQVGKKLSVLAASQPFIPALICITKWLKDDPFENTFKSNSVKIHQKISGRQIMVLLKIQRLAAYKEEYVTSYNNLIHAHKAIKK